MKKQQELLPEDLAGAYEQIASFTSVDVAIKIYNSMRGQQVTLPQRLYSTNYIRKVVAEEGGADKISSARMKKLASDFEYSERQMREIIKKIEEACSCCD